MAAPDQRRILVIGAGGQVGRELLKILPALASVTATARQAAAPGIAPSCRPLDLADANALRDLVREARPQLIVNAAAYTAVDAAETHEAEAMAINAHAPAILAEEAKQLGAALVHYSTDYVFNGSGPEPWQEHDPPEPLNAYGRTKLAGEQAIQQSGVAHAILRTSWVYGLGSVNFVKKMLQLARTRRELSVVDDQMGAPTSARFLAEVTADLAAQAAADPQAWFSAHGGLLHAVCGGETSWRGFAEEIFRQAGELHLPVESPVIRPVPSSAFPTPAKRPQNSRLKTDRLRAICRVGIPHWADELRRNLPALHAEESAESGARPQP